MMQPVVVVVSANMCYHNRNQRTFCVRFYQRFHYRSSLSPCHSTKWLITESYPQNLIFSKRRVINSTSKYKYLYPTVHIRSQAQLIVEARINSNEQKNVVGDSCTPLEEKSVRKYDDQLVDSSKSSSEK